MSIKSRFIKKFFNDLNSPIISKVPFLNPFIWRDMSNGVDGQVFQLKESIPTWGDMDSILLKRGKLFYYFVTFNEALDFSIEGDIIYLLNGNYGDIIINKNGISIVGSNSKSVFIQNLHISGKDNYLCNFSISGDLYITTNDNYIPHSYNFLEHIILYGNVYLGTPTTSASYGWVFRDCHFAGLNKEIVINAYPEGETPWGWHILQNCIVKPLTKDTTWFPDSYDLKIYSGNVYIDGGHINRFKSINYLNTDKQALLYFSNCLVVETKSFNCSGNTTSYGVFNLRNCIYYPNGPTHIFGKFVFNLFNSDLFLPNDANIIYDSIAPSRFINVTEKFYNSNAVIEGNKLENLHIFNSIFHCNPPAGLGSNSNNSWNAFIDY
jgi:hypothetical protein